MTEALTETANVLTAVSTSDSGGGATQTTTVGPDIICRLDTLAGNEGENAERISDRSTHLATLPAGTPITTRNDLRVDNRGTFEVTAVRQATGEHARFVELVGRD
jgi:hypothetical protein